MSSIDKYVIGEARKYDPRVRVTHEGGNLVGRVDGKVVFSIADRYGYLNNSERDAIRTSFDLFEEQEKERRRMEREKRRMSGDVIEFPGGQRRDRDGE